jgi:preprotein translocase subunit SecB
MMLFDFEMTNIRLVKSMFMPNPDFDPRKSLPRLAKPSEIVLSIKNSGDFENEGRMVNFTQNFRIERSSLMPFTLEVEYWAVFKAENPVPQKEQAHYISKIFPHAVFPYLREYVSQITVRAGFPPILLHLAFTQPAARGRKEAAEKAPDPRPVIKWMH